MRARQGREAARHGGAAPHPLWYTSGTTLIYPELDAIGNVRRLHVHPDPQNPSAPEIGTFGYSAFGKSIAVPSAPGGTVGGNPRFTWQGKRQIGTNLYDSRARVWSAELGVFLQPDEYGFLTPTGTFWSWQGQNSFRYADHTGRDPVGRWIGSAVGEILGGGIGGALGAVAGGAATVETGPGAIAGAGVGAVEGGELGADFGALAGGEIGDALGDALKGLLAHAKDRDDDEECEGGRSKGRQGHREKTRGANRADRKQIDAAARQAGVDDRNGFGDFIESEKKAMGRGGSENFTWEELLDLAEQFKNGGGG